MRLVRGLSAAAAFLASIAANATLVELTGVAQMEAGGKHGCAVTTAGGVKCWGAAAVAPAPRPAMSR